MQISIKRELSRLDKISANYPDEQATLIATIEKKVRSPNGFSSVVTAIDELQTIYEITGSKKILRGDTSGWEDMSVMVWLEELEVAVCSCSLAEKREWFGYSEISLLRAFFDSLGFGDFRFAEWCAGFVHTAYRSKEYRGQGAVSPWSLYPTSTFALELSSAWLPLDEDRIEMPLSPLGPFNDVIVGWNDDSSERIKSGLESMCDYFIAERRRPQTGDLTIGNTLWPSQIIAVLNLRKHLQLPVPTNVEHPLMNTPMASQPGAPVTLPRYEWMLVAWNYFNRELRTLNGCPVPSPLAE